MLPTIRKNHGHLLDLNDWSVIRDKGVNFLTSTILDQIHEIYLISNKNEKKVAN